MKNHWRDFGMIILEINDVSFPFYVFAFLMFILVKHYFLFLTNFFNIKMGNLVLFLMLSCFFKIFFRWNDIRSIGRKLVIRLENQQLKNFTTVDRSMVGWSLKKDNETVTKPFRRILIRFKTPLEWFKNKFCNHLNIFVYNQLMAHLIPYHKIVWGIKTILRLLKNIIIILDHFFVFFNYQSRHVLFFFLKIVFLLVAKIIYGANKLNNFIQVRWIRGRTKMEVFPFVINYFFSFSIISFLILLFFHDYASKFSVLLSEIYPGGMLITIAFLGIIWLIFAPALEEILKNNSQKSATFYIGFKIFLFSFIFACLAGYIIYHYSGKYVIDWVRISVAVSGFILIGALSFNILSEKNV